MREAVARIARWLGRRGRDRPRCGGRGKSAAGEAPPPLTRLTQMTLAGRIGRVLLIDDSEDSRDLTEAALLSAGYNDIVLPGPAGKR